MDLFSFSLQQWGIHFTRVWSGMGIALIVIGSLSIVAQIAGMSISISLADSVAGIWSGIFVIILIHYSLQIQGFNPVADSGTPRGPSS